MKKLVIFLVLHWMLSGAALAKEDNSDHKRIIDTDSTVVTQHKVTIEGKRINYQATAGTQPVWNEKGEPTATLFYTYYQRTDIKDTANRPLMISFNGGPGSGSVWMHVAYTGPRVLNIDSEGYPIQPYGVQENPFSILDVADIVYVNPVNTGYSRMLEDAEGKLPTKDQQQKMFFGVNADIKYLAEWINTFVSRNERWRSPKFLIGESYGTTRVSGLAAELQNDQWMYLNGVILVSPTDIGIERKGIVKAANRLPYFAAAAWYHKVLPADLQSKPLLDVLSEVEEFTLNEYLPAMAYGASLSEQRRNSIITKAAHYSGLEERIFRQNNLDVSTWLFWKELLRDKGLTIGRLDSRYLGIDRVESGSRPDYSAELTSWLHSFTPAINYYLREELGYKTDIKYNMFGPVHPWDNRDNKVGEGLRRAMAANPYLKVMIQSGYFDGATNYFDGKYNMWHIDPSGKMKDRISFKGYESGHMMYLRREDLQQSNEDIREFIRSALPGDQPAKY